MGVEEVSEDSRGGSRAVGRELGGEGEAGTEHIR